MHSIHPHNANILFSIIIKCMYLYERINTIVYIHTPVICALHRAERAAINQ